MVEDLGFDGGSKACVLTPIKRLCIVTRAGIEPTKAIRAHLASKRKHINAAQQALDPTLLVGHTNERSPANWTVQLLHEPERTLLWTGPCSATIGSMSAGE